MAEINPASFYDENDVERLSGRIEAPDGLTATGLSTPDVGSTATAENITVKAGDSATPGSGTGGSVTIQSGDGDTPGGIHILRGIDSVLDVPGATGHIVLGNVTHNAVIVATNLTVGSAGHNVGFFGTNPVAQPAAPVTLGDVIAALQALGLVAT